MGRDLLTRPYGRFYYLPLELARLGHQVEVITFNYQRVPDETYQRDGLRWHSISLATMPNRWWNNACDVAQRYRPHWVIGCSDILYAIVAQRLATRLHSRLAIDAYDNFEAYMPLAKPLHWWWRRVVAAADLVTVAGPSLQRLLGRKRSGRPPVIVPMAPDPTGFYAMDRFRARARLGLDPTQRFVGYAGSIYRSRGIDQFFAAYELLQQQLPDVAMLLSGRLERGIKLPRRAHYLGYVDDRLMPTVINSLEAMAVLNRPSSFGHYSYPIKLYEAMQCGVPVVASRTQSTAWILEQFPDMLVEPNQPQMLARALLDALTLGRVDYGRLASWADGARDYDVALNALT